MSKRGRATPTPTPTAIDVYSQLATPFVAQGVTIERVLTDNGNGNRST